METACAKPEVVGFSVDDPSTTPACRPRQDTHSPPERLSDCAVTYIILFSIILYIILYYINYPPTPLAAGGARQGRNYQQQGPRSHYKQQGQEARKQERRSKKQEAITGNKRQEARNKKPGSNKRLEDRSES